MVSPVKISKTVMARAVIIWSSGYLDRGYPPSAVSEYQWTELLIDQGYNVHQPLCLLGELESSRVFRQWQSAKSLGW
jgi:hypothetical protein